MSTEDKRCGNCRHWSRYAKPPEVLDGICYGEAIPCAPMQIVADETGGLVGGTWLETKADHYCDMWAAHQ